MTGSRFRYHADHHTARTVSTRSSCSRWSGGKVHLLLAETYAAAGHQVTIVSRAYEAVTDRAEPTIRG